MSNVNKFNYSGTIYRKGTKERITKAVLKATKENLPEVTERSDEDGNFKFSQLDAGKWTIEVLHGESRPEKKDIELKDSIENEIIELSHLMNNKDQTVGTLFFYGLIISFIALFILYVYLHTSCSEAKGPLSSILVESISETEAHVSNMDRQIAELISIINKIDEILVNNRREKSPEKKYIKPMRTAVTERKKDETLKLIDSLKLTAPKEVDELVAQAQDKAENLVTLNDDAELKVLVTKIDTIFTKVLEANLELVPADKKLIEEQLDNIHSLLKTDNSKDLINGLTELRQSIESPPIHGFILWKRIPWLYLEVLFWALTGALTNILISSGYYLRMQRFYREGIKMYLSHIITTPVMVLVAMILLSLVSFEFSLSDDGSPVKIDLSNPNILAAFSFLLAIKPWALWDFIKTSNKKITGGDSD